MNQHLISRLADAGIEVTVTNNPKKGDSPAGKNVDFYSNLTGFLTLARECDKLPFSERENHSRAKECLLTTENEAWIGGSYTKLCSDLVGNVNMKPFQEAREKFEKSGLLDRIKTGIQDYVPRRKRCLSEHDGEWDMNRRWDIQPFQATRRAMTPGRTLEIVCHFAVNSYGDAKDIDRYGCMAWAISDLIESAGVSTRILWVASGRRIWDYKQTNTFTQTIELKKAGQYIAPSLLAGVFQSNFWRRIGFVGICMAADVMEKEVDTMLGQSNEQPHKIKFEDGKLILSPDSIHATTAEMESEIMKAIGAKVPAAA